MKRPVDEWLQMDEVSFHKMLVSDISETGEIGDVFPMMVMHNVPHFILAELWPSKWKEYRKEPVPVAFAVAEEGWKGRIKNIHSRVERASGGWNLQVSKSYVINAEHILFLAKAEKGYALAYVRGENRLDRRARSEPHTWMDVTAGERVEHARVKGSVNLHADDVNLLSQTDYGKVGREVPMREITSVAVLSTGMRIFHGMDSPEAQEEAELLLQDRAEGRIPQEAVGRAVTMLQAFIADAGRAGLTLHSFWSKALEYAAFAVPTRES